MRSRKLEYRNLQPKFTLATRTRRTPQTVSRPRHDAERKITADLKRIQPAIGIFESQSRNPEKKTRSGKRLDPKVRKFIHKFLNVAAKRFNRGKGE